MSDKVLVTDGAVPAHYELVSDVVEAAMPGISLPAGIIVMWSGLLSNIPSGWALCDGLNGTPDLRGAFIRGASIGADPGGTGGSATHTHAPHDDHTINQVINHTHPINITDPGHSHLTQRYPTATGGSSGFTIDTSMSGTLADNTLPTKTNTTGISAASTNPAGGVASIVLSHSAHSEADNLPPYFALAFIMKL